MNRYSTLILASLLTMFSMISACGNSTVCSGNCQSSFVSIAIPLTGDECGIVSAEALVTGADMDPVGPIALFVGSDSITGLVPDVPAGLQRTLWVGAYNDQGAIVYEGSTEVDVEVDQTTIATVVFYRNFDNCPSAGGGTGDIALNGSLDNTDPSLLEMNFDFSDAVLVGGTLYFLDEDADCIRRFDLDTMTLLDRLDGSGEAEVMAIDPLGQVAYLGYAGGRIDEFDLASGEAQFFVAVSDDLQVLAVTGDYLFTIDESGYSTTHSLYNRATRELAFTAMGRDGSRSHVWAAGLERMFYINSGLSPEDIVMIDFDLVAGTLGEDVDSPYHGTYDFVPPLKLQPDESRIVTANGHFFSTEDLTYQASFGFYFADLVFYNNNYYLLNQVGGNVEIRTLDATFSIITTSYAPGTLRRGFSYGDNLVLVTGDAGAPVDIQLLPFADL